MRRGSSATTATTRQDHDAKPSVLLRRRSYSLCLPVWYRAESETEWHTGLTRSVSTTGALIRADEAGAPAEQIIVAIGLPSVTGCLVGSGRVVKVIRSTGDAAAATFEVQVDEYRLDSRDAVLRRIVH
jgi:hypothetical protein